MVLQNFIPFALFLTGAAWFLFALRFFAHLVELILFVLYLFVCVMFFYLRCSIFFMRWFFLCVTLVNLLMFGFYFAFSFLLRVMLFNMLMFCLLSLRFRFLWWLFWTTVENGPNSNWPSSDDMSLISQFLNREVSRSQNRCISSAFITFTFLKRAWWREWSL